MEPLNRPYRNREEANGESMIPVDRQPDDLRTRIAKRLHDRYADSLVMGSERAWDDEHPMARDDWLRDADAVIRELGLRIQVAGPDGIVGTGDYRYVTDFFPREAKEPYGCQRCDCSCCYGYEDCHCVSDVCNCGETKKVHGG